MEHKSLDGYVICHKYCYLIDDPLYKQTTTPWQFKEFIKSNRGKFKENLGFPIYIGEKNFQSIAQDLGEFYAKKEFNLFYTQQEYYNKTNNHKPRFESPFVEYYTTELNVNLQSGKVDDINSEYENLNQNSDPNINYTHFEYNLPFGSLENQCNDSQGSISNSNNETNVNQYNNFQDNNCTNMGPYYYNENDFDLLVI